MLLRLCLFGGIFSFFFLFFRWNTGSMTSRVTFIVIGLLSILGLCKVVRILAVDTADDVKFNKEKVSHHMHLDIRKTRILIAARALIFSMLIVVIAFLSIPSSNDDILLCDMPMTMWMGAIAILILIFLLALGIDKIDKKLEKFLGNPSVDEIKFNEKRVSHYMKLLKSLRRNSVQISLAENSNVPLPAGCSKYGGRPDVADDFQWPHDTSGRPLSLLLQIDCADLAPLDREGLLPSSGQLYFFYELSKMNRSGQKNAVQVIYNDQPSSQLHPLDYPANLDKKYQLQECRLQFFQRRSIPSIEELGHLTDKPFNDKYRFEYEEAFDRLEESWTGIEGIGSMLGFAFLIQEPIVDDLSDNVLLLELDSSEYWPKDDKTPHDLTFGDHGIIYFYIKREDLQARRFDSIKFALQCY